MARSAYGEFGNGNSEKDRRRRKIRLDKERKRDKFKKGSRRRKNIIEDDWIIDRDEELDFGWN